MRDIQLIHGFVDVMGTSKKKIIYCMFDVVNTSEIVLTTYCGKDFNDKNIPIDPTLIPTPAIGKIQDSDGNGLAGVKVSFIKDYIVTDKNINQKGAVQIVVDYCITDINGQYMVFIEPGIYTIRIDGGQAPQIFTNQEVTMGLQNQYYYLIDKGLIQKKYSDVIEFNGITKKLVYGEMISQNKRPLIDTEIVISQNDVIVAYIKTDKSGKYNFAIDNGIYDVRIRGPKQPIKIMKDFNFEDGKGFMEVIGEQSNLFKASHSDVIII